jgi:hypothetical protein
VVGALTRARWSAFGAAVAVTLGLAGVGTVHLVSAADSDAPQSVFVPLTPARILDTRVGIGGITGPIASGSSFEMQVAGQGGVPADATGVVMNVTATQTTAAGYITVWPTGEPQPITSNLNVNPGQDVPNLVTVKLGAAGRLSVFNFGGSVQILADVAGYYVGTDDFVRQDDITNFGVVRWARVQVIGTSASIYQDNQHTGFAEMSASRTAEGVYEVMVPGVKADGGYYSMFVSAEQGQTSVFRACKVFRGATAGDAADTLVVIVRCYDQLAALRDSDFSILVLH